MSHLDLTGADTSGFEPLPTAEYNAIITGCTKEVTAGGADAKLPAGSPFVKVEYTIQDEPYVGRLAYNNLMLLGQDEAKTHKALGMFVNFIAAVTGRDADQVKVEGFDLEELGTLEQRECVVRLGPPNKKNNPENTWNTVKGTKPAGSKGVEAAPHGIL